MKKRYLLKRRYFRHGTYSELLRQDGSFVCCVVEQPWNNNRMNQSCVPEGEYNLVPHESPKFGKCYALESESLGVTRFGPSLRTHILIHVANKASELRGCLAVGKEFGCVGTFSPEWAVLDSKTTLKKLLEELDGETATLTITKH